MNELKLYDPKSLAKTLSPKKELFEKHLGKDTFEKEIAFAAQVIGASAKLQGCTPESILRAIYNISLVGLSLNPVLKQAYLTPRWNSAAKVNECLLMPSYSGLAKLGMEAGGLKKIEAILVMEGDEFSMDWEANTIVHKTGISRGKVIVGVYARAILPSGIKQYEVMDKAMIDEVRACSDSYKAFKDGKASSSIWNDWEGEMTRKTVIKRILKYLPKVNDEQAARYGEAERLDNRDYGATDLQIQYIESLLHTSTFDEDRKTGIEAAIYAGGLTQEAASGMIETLKMNQLNSLTERGSGNQGEVQKQLDRHVK